MPIQWNLLDRSTFWFHDFWWYFNIPGDIWMFRVSGSESLKIIPPFFPTAVFFGGWILGPPKSRTLGYRCQFGHRRQPWFLFRHKMRCTSFVKREVRYPTNFYTKMGKAGDRIFITKKNDWFLIHFKFRGYIYFFLFNSVLIPKSWSSQDLRDSKNRCRWSWGNPRRFGDEFWDIPTTLHPHKTHKAPYVTPWKVQVFPSLIHLACGKVLDVYYATPIVPHLTWRGSKCLTVNALKWLGGDGWFGVFIPAIVARVKDWNNPAAWWWMLLGVWSTPSE